MDPVLVKKDVSIPYTIDWIRSIAISAVRGVEHPEVERITEIVRDSPEPLKTLFDAAYSTLLYSPDPDGFQDIRTFDNMFRTRRGNCVTYTELISAVLFNLGIEHFYDVISYDKPNEFNHIYIQVKNTILDPVLGQAQDGSDTWTNRPPSGRFNQETNYKYKIKYFMPDLRILQGTQDYTGTRYLSRTKRSRMQLAYGTLNGVQEGQLGKTIVGKILGGAVDILHGIANVLVTPVEGVLHTQIVGDNYSDTGFGNFISQSQNVNSSLNKLIGGTVSSFLTGGAVKIEDVDKTTLTERAQALIDIQANTQAHDQAVVDTNNQIIAQQQFEALNQQAAQQQATAAQQLAANAARNKKIIIGTTIGLATIGTGVLIYKNFND